VGSATATVAASSISTAAAAAAPAATAAAVVAAVAAVAAATTATGADGGLLPRRVWSTSALPVLPAPPASAGGLYAAAQGQLCFDIGCPRAPTISPPPPPPPGASAFGGTALQLPPLYNGIPPVRGATAIPT